MVVFEDAESGVKAAKSGGFFAVGVGSEEQLGQADMVVPSMKEVTLQDLKSWVRPA